MRTDDRPALPMTHKASQFRRIDHKQLAAGSLPPSRLSSRPTGKPARSESVRFIALRAQVQRRFWDPPQLGESKSGRA